MYYSHTLPNGIRIVGQQIEGFRSVSVGIWTQTGSANEVHESERGITHFIEHMLFKGTKSRTAQQIAQEFDGMGGILNAFTSKECTCYHARVSEDKLSQALGILSDLVMHATMDPADMDKEKGVVVEEINMAEDTPEDLAHDLLSQAFFQSHALALPILGNRESVSGFTRDGLIAYMKRRYTACSMVVAAAGGFDFSELCDEVQKTLGSIDRCDIKVDSYPTFEPEKGTLIMREKPVEQAHLCLAMPGYALGDDRIYALSALNNVFGGSMSSRLFQLIREQRGLAYDIYSHPASYRNCGSFTIYTGVNAAQAPTALNLILEEMEGIKKGGVTQEEFVRAKDQLKGNYILGLESTSSRMNAIGKSMTLQDRITTAEETIGKIEAITIDDVHEVLDHVFDREKVSISAVGKIDTKAIETIFNGQLL
jgi:predicted Zn-dependent peptidase